MKSSLGKANESDLTFTTKKNISFSLKRPKLFTVLLLKIYQAICRFRKNYCKKVLVELARVTKIMYPSSDVDYPDFSLKKSSK